MKIEKRDITVTKEEYFFVAEDGTEFTEEYDCKQYELEVKKHSIKDILTKENITYRLVQESVYYEDTDGFYYIKDENEMQELWQYFELKHGRNPAKHSKCYYDGDGWYVFINVGDVHCEYAYEDYYSLIKVDFKAWREWLAQFDWMKEVAE